MTLYKIIVLYTTFILRLYCINTENPDIRLLQEYIQINTSHPDPDYESAISWIKHQANNLSLKFNRLNLTSKINEPPGLPIVWLTWHGSDPLLPSVFLYTHMDVVGVDLKGWTVDPFEGVVKEGKIYGRGTQDMKSIAVQELQAIRNLQIHDFKPTRTIHIGFFPDEEKGGYEGINLFIHTAEFKSLNIGFVLDEGMNNEELNSVDFYYTERETLWIKFKALGTTGHGSRFLNNTAGEKLQKVIDRMLNLREQEKWRLNIDKSLRLGDVTTVNLDMMEGGIQVNVIPPWLSVTFDIRVTPHWDISEFRHFLNETCREAGDGVSYELLLDINWDLPSSKTNIRVPSWWFKSFNEAFQSMNLKLVPRIYPAGTDGRTLRQIGIPVLGFSPTFKTPNLMHAHDEYLLVDDFMRGIEIYTTLIKRLASSSMGEVDSTQTPTTVKPDEIISANTTSKKISQPSGCCRISSSQAMILIVLVALNV